MAKKKTKWNRKHEFQWHQPNENSKRHPAYVYAHSSNKNKFLLFTHSATTAGETNEKLKYNIDPNEKERTTYVRKRYFVEDKTRFKKADRSFRLHKSDKEIIKKFMK